MASVDVNSQPRQQPIFWNHLVTWVRAVPRVAILSMVGPSLLCVIGYFGWLNYGAHKLDVAYYGIKKENVFLTAQPPWIRKKNKVLDEVFSGSDLSRHSLLDARTPGYLASVFDAHPWVRKTNCVQPLAGGVKIDVEYRVPVAMVACVREGREPDFFAIDGDAILLDHFDFNKADVPLYIWIYAKDANTTSKEGKPFGDPRVEEAAKLCRFLLLDRERCKISRVVVYPPTLGRNNSMLEIQTVLETKSTKEGPRFQWGSCPGMESPGESPPEIKLAKLKEIVSDNQRWKPGLVDLTGTQK